MGETAPAPQPPTNPSTGHQMSQRESESLFNFVIIAVFLEFVSVLEKGLRPLVLAINVSKFLPASIAVKDN